MHEQVRRSLDTGLRNRNFWLSISVQIDEEGGLDWSAFHREVEPWLDDLDPDALGDQPLDERTWEFSWGEVSVQVWRKGEQFRNEEVPVVANPAPAVAFWSGS